jgi:hypothetical protein
MRAGSQFRTSLLAIAFALVAAMPGHLRAAPATFLDASAWLSAVAGLPGQGIVQLPQVSLDRITLTDGFGTWTHNTPTVTYFDGEFWQTASRGSVTTGPRGGNPLTAPLSGEIFGGAASTWAGGLYVQFGCNSAVFPCVGISVIELDLGRPVMGFAGHLEYLFDRFYYDPDAIPLLALAHSAAEPPPPESTPLYFEGFFGVLFEQPTSVLRIAWHEGQSLDDSSVIRFTNAVMVTETAVPEPAGALVLAAVLPVLLLAARPYGAAAPSASRKA